MIQKKMSSGLMRGSLRLVCDFFGGMGVWRRGVEVNREWGCGGGQEVMNNEI